MDCKDGGHFTIQQHTIRFIDGPCPLQPECLAELSKVCSMNPKQIVTFLSSDSLMTVIDDDSNAWLTVSTVLDKTKMSVAMTVCRIRLNGHDSRANTIGHFPVSLRDADASYSFVLQYKLESRLWISPGAFDPSPFSAPEPLLTVSLVKPGVRRIGRCNKGGHGRSTHRDALTDFVLEQTRQTQVLEFGRGRMNQPERHASGNNHEVDLVYIYRPESGDECFLAVPHSRCVYGLPCGFGSYAKILGAATIDCIPGLRAEPFLVECLNSRAYRGQNQKHNSGWANLRWDGMILAELKQQTLPELATVISGYVGHHSVPIEPHGKMIQRCRAFDAFCGKRGVVPDWQWYEWAMIASPMAELLGESVSLWLDAFDPLTGDRNYYIKFGPQTSSQPVSRSVAITAGAMKLRNNFNRSAMTSLIGTEVDTYGIPLSFSGSFAVTTAIPQDED